MKQKTKYLIMSHKRGHYAYRSMWSTVGEFSTKAERDRHYLTLPQCEEVYRIVDKCEEFRP